MGIDHKVSALTWPTCPKCKHSIIDTFSSSHVELCDWYVFRDTTADELGWSIIDSTESRYIETVLNLLNIEHRTFAISSTIGCNYIEMYAPRHISEMINLFYSKLDGFAGMTLAEFIKSISDDR